MRPHRWLVPASLVLSLALLIGCGKAVAEGGRTVSATLSGASAAPGPGDARGSGTATLTLDPAAGSICYTLTVSGLGAVTSAHLHRGVAGQTGPAMVTLKVPASGRAKDCATADKQLVASILQNPGNYYLDVHSSDFPAGAIRGQLK